MRKVVATLVGGLLIGAFAASHAKLPPAPAKSEEQKAAEAQKAAATKAKEAELLNRAQEKAVANYKKNQAASMGAAKK
ncbi:MAG TPA: hypothetical protein VHG88_01065 [Burkholderiales bacterium]|nr:hypothetical protein [Burkholderiales bacterium]